MDYSKCTKNILKAPLRYPFTISAPMPASPLGLLQFSSHCRGLGMESWITMHGD